MSRSWIVRCPLVAPVAALLLAGCTAPSAPDQLSALPPGKFVRLPALQTRLDPAQLNHALLAAALFHETNRVRREHGLRPFRWLAPLDEAADLQANSIALDQTVSHINLFPALLTMSERLDRVGLPRGRAGENVAALPLLDVDSAHGIRITRRDDQSVAIDDATGRIGQPHTYASFAATALQAWMDSPEHRANILEREFASLGCSGRVMKRISSIEMIACVQVFYTSPSGRGR
ncbi:CAP domain-containing protein [Opitutus terrae]|nr:CAP domain-containing protein [Opitutus terrae]